MKIRKYIYIYIYFFFWGGGGVRSGGGCSGGGGLHGGCEQRIEVFVKIQTKMGGGGGGSVGGRGWGVRVDVTEK